MPDKDFDPFHDFTVPQDADLVAAPTPNAEDTDADGEASSGDGKPRKLDDDPLGADPDGTRPS